MRSFDRTLDRIAKWVRELDPIVRVARLEQENDRHRPPRNNTMTDTEIAKRLDSLTRRLDALEAAIRSRKDRAGLELRLAVMEREAEAREAAAKKATTTKTPAKKTPAKKGKKAP